MESVPLMTVDDALRRVIEGVCALPGETVALDRAAGRILADAIVSPRDLPPFANSAMDGFALRAADTLDSTPAAPRRLRVVERVAAGAVASRHVAPGQAIRIMTGAPIPPGADAVVKFEDTGCDDPNAVILFAPVAPGCNIRRAGEDVERGATPLRAGEALCPAALALLAALGYASAPCVRRPRVAIIATGDELTPLGQPLDAGKIYESNGVMLAALARQYGAEVIMNVTVSDETPVIQRALRDGAERGADLVLTSGGVSVGDLDLVKDALRAEGRLEFWRIRMRPGKPLVFGRVHGIPLLGLPGTPLAAFVGCALFGAATLRRMQGRDPQPPLVEARCAEPIRNGSGKRHFLRGVTTLEGGQLLARLAGGQLPSQLSTLAHSDCLLVAHEDRALYAPGELIPILPLGPALPAY